jgi:energy-coupling factor transport system ATP-binding protein
MNNNYGNHAAVSVKDFSFTYAGAEEKALDGVSFEVARGGLVLLCGASGSGKTTLLRNLKPEITPAGERAGSIRIFGRDGLTPRESAESVGFVMQDPDNQIVMDSVWLELAFGLENLGVAPEETGRRIGEIAAFFGIDGWFGKSVFELSGGQKQILSLAAVIAMQAEIIVLDEPTARLDPIAAGEFLHMLKRVNRELGKTVILSEHNLEEVLSDADKALYLDAGRVVYDGDSRGFPGFLTRTGSTYAAALPAPTRLAVRYAAEAGTHDGDAGFPLDVKQGRAWLGRLGLPVCGTVRREANRGGDIAITARDLWFRYNRDDDFVLKGLDADMPEGGLHIFVGSNGSGKSTLLGVLADIYKPFRGKVTIPEGRKLRMLFQNPKSVFVRDAVVDDLHEHDVSITDADVHEMADRLHLDKLLDRHPYDLSAGEMQKAALAKALLTRPDILLLDEPTKGLDAFAKREIGDILTGLKDSGVTIVMVTHDIAFAAEYADTCSMLFGGAIIASGRAREFFDVNMFYTTSISRMTRGVATGCVLEGDVVFGGGAAAGEAASPGSATGGAK